MLEIQNNVFLAFDLETTGLSPEYGENYRNSCHTYF